MQRRTCARTAHLQNGRDVTLCVLQHRHCCPHRRHSLCVLHRRLGPPSSSGTSSPSRHTCRCASNLASSRCCLPNFLGKLARCKRRVVDRRISANEPGNHAHLPGAIVSCALEPGAARPPSLVKQGAACAAPRRRSSTVLGAARLAAPDGLLRPAVRASHRVLRTRAGCSKATVPGQAGCRVHVCVLVCSY